MSGWKFNIYSDAECANLVAGPLTSAADGTITSGYLKPGTYYVQEVEEKEQYPGWTFDTTVRKVFVTAGQTAEVKFTNALRPGRISIQKVDGQGEPLAGASFQLEWSDDGGNTWKAVAYSDEAEVVKGGCSNPNLTDGCLTSGEDGVVEWGNLYPGIRYRITEVKARRGISF